MERRGLGVINVKDLFGIASTRLSKRVELVVQLERWEHGREYERLGLELIDASGSPEQVQAELRRRVAAILGDPTCR